MDAIGIIIIDLIFVNFVAKSILEHMRALTKTNDPRQPVIVVIATIVAQAHACRVGRGIGERWARPS